jgi:hypothetical protein
VVGGQDVGVGRRPDRQRLAEPGVVEGPSARRWVWADASRDRCGRVVGDHPPVTVAMTVPNSEGTVLIDYQTVTAAELAAARRAEPPS